MRGISEYWNNGILGEFIDPQHPTLYIPPAMALYAVKKGNESNDRLMNRFKKQFQGTRLGKTLRDKMRYRKSPTKRMVRIKALKREWFRGKNRKAKFYSNM